MWAQYWDQYCPLSTHRVFKLWDAGLNTAVYMHYWVSWRERPSLVPWGDVQGEASSLPVLLVNAQKKKKKNLESVSSSMSGSSLVDWCCGRREKTKTVFILFIIQSDSVLEQTTVSARYWEYSCFLSNSLTIWMDVRVTIHYWIHEVERLNKVILMIVETWKYSWRINENNKVIEI